VTNRFSRATKEIKSVIFFIERKEKFSFHAIMNRMKAGQIHAIDARPGSL
jgi:hypothetical protein